MNFADKLNFAPTTVIFIEKEYTVKTDHKTGLLLNDLMKKQPEDSNVKTVELLLGKKQAGELFEEMEQAGAEKGGENYIQNMNAIVFGLLAIVFDQPYEKFEKAYKDAGKN